MSPSVKIDDRLVGNDHPPYIVAEISGNHNGDLGRAIAMLEAAAEAGVDAVKLQTYTADTITIDYDGEGFVIEGGLWDKRRLYDLYKEAHTPWEWHPKLFQKGQDLGLSVFSSPFDISAVEFLEDLGTPAYKIASFELIDHPLIERCAATGKPLVISTGIASRAEINEAVSVARRSGCKDLILLHCISSYPAEPKDSNLLTLRDLASSFGVIPGLSDHSHGVAVSVAATALGACLIEKHFTLCRDDGGPDAAFSLEPVELRELVDNCHSAWQAIGEIYYQRKGCERGSELLRRSIYVVEDVEVGAEFTTNNIRSIRPGLGLAPKFLPEVLGRRAGRDLKRGDPLAWEMIESDG